MGRLLKYFLYLCLLSIVGLLGYSYFGDISAPEREIRETIDIPDSE
ncbi:MAG: hypothetical protein AAF826_06585 [Pseudomonadota bacterium]